MPMAAFQPLGSLAAVEAHLWALGTFLYSAVAVASHCGERWEQALEWWRATMWAELAGSAAAVLSLLPYYLSERGLPFVGIAADGSISRAGAKRVGGGGVGAVVLWVIVRRLAGLRRKRSAPEGQGETAPGARALSPNTRVEDWLASEGLGACAAVLGQLGYDQRIDLLIVRHTNVALHRTALPTFARHASVCWITRRCRGWCAYAGKRRRRVARYAACGVRQHLDPEAHSSQI